MAIRPLAGSSDALTIDVCSPIVMRFIPRKWNIIVPYAAGPIDDQVGCEWVLSFTREKSLLLEEMIIKMNHSLA
jgi:hypothetical protein